VHSRFLAPPATDYTHVMCVRTIIIMPIETWPNKPFSPGAQQRCWVPGAVRVDLAAIPQ
jgi:hypothetical protein